MTAPNRNLLWAEIIVEELIRSGLRRVCIAPGSRSTPLALAFHARRDQVKIYSHLDERSAAYFALGLALAGNAPIAVLCTSGTAAANFYPAVIEAYQSRVPLLVLTADRAHELRESGANQTIDQVKMYGDNVLWSVDVAPPEAAPPAVVIRSLRTLIGRAMATANGARKGPVHLNIPFRKPLEPIPVPTDITVIPPAAQAQADDQPFTTLINGINMLTPEQAQAIAAILNDHERGLILCGPGTPEAADEAIADLARRTGYPLIVDGLASLRFSPYNQDLPLISTHDSFLGGATLEEPEVLIRFGNVPTSAALITWLMALQVRYAIHFNDVWSDDSHRVSHLIQADPVQACRAISAQIVAHPATDWQRSWHTADQTAWQIIDTDLPADFFDGQVVAEVVAMLPEESVLFIGNSLPVRHLDQFGKPTAKRLHLYANRGASGIDGVVSTALGVAAAHPDRQLTLVIGDISLYHDMNGLLAIRRCGIPITIVLINNDGGGIFQRLPIREFEPAFTDLFLTPHGLDFEHTARLYGLDYAQVTTRAEFAESFAGRVDQARLIEVRTDVDHDWTRRQAITQAVASHLQDKLGIQGS